MRCSPGTCEFCKRAIAEGEVRFQQTNGERMWHADGKCLEAGILSAHKPAAEARS